MSNITENTIVIRKEYENDLINDYKKYNVLYRIMNFNKVYSNKDIVIYVFDSNGECPWEIEPDVKTKYIALETNYLDGESLWTRIAGFKEDEITIEEWLQTIIPKKDYRDVVQKISYSF